MTETSTGNGSESDDAFERDLLLDFITEGAEQLDACNTVLEQLKTAPRDSKHLNALFRSLHAIKGVAGFMGLRQLENVAHATEDLLEDAREGLLVLQGPTLDAMWEASNVLGQLITQMSDNIDQVPWVAPSVEQAPALIERIRTLRTPSDDPTAESDVPTVSWYDFDAEENAPSAVEKQDSTERVSAARSIRVDGHLLDSLLDGVGELLVYHSMVMQALEAARQHDALRQLERMSNATRDMQSLGGSLRMVPLQACFDKMRRLANDVAEKSQKQIRISIEGEDELLDKGVLDAISDPLVHLIRNAIDHGLEDDADARSLAGKSSWGRIQLRATHCGGQIHIEVEDDGRGMSRQRIAAVAISKGLIQTADGMTDDDVFRLVCAAGFSTKEKVTSLSGRGVGMDIVLRKIEEVGGTLNISSREGLGTIFSLQIPLTFAVISGQVVRVGSQRFVVPMQSVFKLLRPTADQIRSVLEQTNLFVDADSTLAMWKLSELFQLQADNDREPVILIAEAEGQRVALQVDELLGQQHLVVKSLGSEVGVHPGVSSTAVMPDGRISLVLDILGLIHLGTHASARQVA